VSDINRWTNTSSGTIGLSVPARICTLDITVSIPNLFRPIIPSSNILDPKKISKM
jgi:hypothetical protein